MISLHRRYNVSHSARDKSPKSMRCRISSLSPFEFSLFYHKPHPQTRGNPTNFRPQTGCNRHFRPIAARQKIHRMIWSAPPMLIGIQHGMGESLLMAAWFWYFVLYSFLGFLVEVVFARITHNPKRDRKCLYFLPLCPVYGLGVLLMLALPAARSNSWLLFLWAALSATGAEYLMDLFYDRVLGVSFWDYSHLPLNLHGRVCLLFSFSWGILGLIAVRLVHPLAVELVSHIPQAVTLPAALFLALDIGFSVFVLRRDGTTDALMWYRRLPARGARHSLPEK